MTYYITTIDDGGGVHGRRHEGANNLYLGLLSESYAYLDEEGLPWAMMGGDDVCLSGSPDPAQWPAEVREAVAHATMPGSDGRPVRVTPATA